MVGVVPFHDVNGLYLGYPWVPQTKNQRNANLFDIVPMEVWTMQQHESVWIFPSLQLMSQSVWTVERMISRQQHMLDSEIGSVTPWLVLAKQGNILWNQVFRTVYIILQFSQWNKLLNWAMLLKTFPKCILCCNSHQCISWFSPLLLAYKSSSDDLPLRKPRIPFGLSRTEKGGLI